MLSHTRGKLFFSHKVEILQNLKAKVAYINSCCWVYPMQDWQKIRTGSPAQNRNRYHSCHGVANVQEPLLMPYIAHLQHCPDSRAFLKEFQGKTTAVQTACCLGSDPRHLNASCELFLKVTRRGEGRKGVSHSSIGYFIVVMIHVLHPRMAWYFMYLLPLVAVQNIQNLIVQMAVTEQELNKIKIRFSLTLIRLVILLKISVKPITLEVRCSALMVFESLVKKWAQ